MDFSKRYVILTWKWTTVLVRSTNSEILKAVKVRKTKMKRWNGGGGKGDQDINEDLSKPFLLVAHPCGDIQSFSVDITLSGMDTKMIKVLNQRTGSYCYCCRATEAEAHDIERVRDGFSADINMEELLDFGRELMTKKGIADEDWSSHVFVAEKEIMLKGLAWKVFHYTIL